MPTNETFQPVRFGNFVLVSQLGKGGMAEVFKARIGGVQGFEKVVCVKRILRHHLGDKSFVDMFVNEAKISARLAHPNIVQVYELGEVDGEFYMSMEFVHGKDLLRIMRAAAAEGAPPPGVGAYIAREMCRALAHAHDHLAPGGQKQPIVHRDISPQNVMLSYDGTVKLVDFGIAKAVEAAREETRTGALKGKCAYMAPEQLDGKKASALTDIFAVGVVLFEMVTGRRLFKGPTDYDTLMRVKTQRVPPPSELQASIPPELDQIVLTALCRNPEERYQRAAAMARDLEQVTAKLNFTSEDMKEFMHKLFPNREEVPDGVVSVTTPLSPSGGSPAPPAPRPVSPSEHAVASVSSTDVDKPPAPGRANLLAAVGGLLVAATIVAFFLFQLLGTNEKNPAAPIAPPAPPPVTAKSVETPVAPPKPAPVVEPVDEVVQLSTTPAGAEVLDGPKLLGTTPLAVRFTPERRTIDLRLSKEGYDELRYRIGASDGPTVLLKLTPHAKRHPGETKPAMATQAPKPHETHEPHVRTFDDVDPVAPKIKPIDPYE